MPPLEWVIDILKEWVIAQCYATEAWVKLQIDHMRDYLEGLINALECSVDRGDPGAPDWTEEDLILDGTWRDLDLSAIVPSGAKTVLIGFMIRDDYVNKDFYLRKKGNINTWNRSAIRTQVANIYIMGDVEGACDSDRFIQYWSSQSVLGKLKLTVKGWWF